MIKDVLLALSFFMTAGIYIPTFKRLLKRKHTRDFSKTATMFIFLVQINGFVLACAEKAPYLEMWYVAQTVLTGLQLYLVHKYWNTPEPQYRSLNGSERKGQGN